MGWFLRFGRPAPGASLDGDHWVVGWSRTAVMGVINVTPDSFSDGGSYASVEHAVRRAEAMAADGAMVVDVGGESTRPGADPVDVAIEIDRVVPVIAAIAGSVDVIVSIDTRHVDVAAAAIDAGAHIVNDISGLADRRMTQLCVLTGTPAVVMHMQGTPNDMQVAPRYGDVVTEVTQYLTLQARQAMEAGLPSVMVDPGIGFGKTLSQNLALLRGLPLSSAHPVLVGASRKGFIGSIADVPVPDQRDAGSIAVHLFAAQHGAAMVRAHDVSGHVQALRMDAALRGSDVVRR